MIRSAGQPDDKIFRTIPSLKIAEPTAYNQINSDSMKFQLFRGLSEGLSLTSTFILIIPILILAFTSLRKKRYAKPLMMSLGVLFLTGLIQNQLLLPVSEDQAELAGLFALMIQPPLAFYFLFGFITKDESKKDMVAGITVFVVAVLALLIYEGPKLHAFLIIYGLGLVLVLLFGLPILIETIRDHQMEGNGLGKVILMASYLAGRIVSLLVWMGYVLFEIHMVYLSRFFQLGIVMLSVTSAIGLWLDHRKETSVQRARMPLIKSTLFR